MRYLPGFILLSAILFSSLHAYNFPDTALDPVTNLGPRTFYPDSVKDRLYMLPFDSGHAYQCINPPWNRPSSGHKGYGIDWNVSKGTRVLAARSGNITYFKDTTTDNASIMISRSDRDSNQLYFTSDLYIHIKIDSNWYKMGQRVERGQVVGVVGSQYHIHLEIQMTGHTGIGKDGRTTEDVPYAIREITNRPDGIPWMGDIGRSQNAFRPTIVAVEKPAMPKPLSNTLSLWPAPFREKLNVSLTLAEPVHGKLVLQDIRGRTLRMLQSGAFEKGGHQVVIHQQGAAAPLSPGVYFVRLVGTNRVIMSRSIVLQ